MINLNKIAVLRNSRGENVPDVLEAARAVIKAGCHGITVHPRPDDRHITRRDVLDLAQKAISPKGCIRRRAFRTLRRRGASSA